MEERWFDEELAGCWLGDGRLDRRLRQLVERMKVGFGESILDRLILDPAHDPPAAKTLSLYLTKIGRLCGYLARAKEPLVRNIVMWCGLARLNDITLEATMQCATAVEVRRTRTSWERRCEISPR